MKSISIIVRIALVIITSTYYHIKSYSQNNNSISIPLKNVSAIAFSPDDQYLLAAKRNLLHLYNAGNDTRIKTFAGALHSKSINQLVFNKNSSLALTASNDKTAKLWSIPDGKVLNTFIGHAKSIVGVGFLQNDNLILTISNRGVIKVFDRTSTKEVYTKNDFKKQIRGFAVTPDGNYFAIGGAEKFVAIYEASSGNLVKKITGPSNMVRSLAFSPDGKLLAAGSDDKTIRVWELETDQLKNEFKQKGWIYDVEFSKDGKYLSAALERNTTNFYNLATNTIALSLNSFKSPVLELSVSPNGKQVACINEFGKGVTLSDITSLNIAPSINFRDQKDTSPPLVLISNPANLVDNKVTIYKDLIDLRGLVSDDSGIKSLKVNGLETRVRENGNFVINKQLALGENFITIEVTDVNDNIALKKFTILRKNMEGEEYRGEDAVNYLFVVSINNYDYWPKLNNAIKDGNDIVSVLMQKYKFDFQNITVIKDEQATRSNIYNGLRSFIEKVKPTDNLVIYFSGHGYFDELLGEGYWIPIEAHPKSTGEYVSNTEILKLVNAINSQHTFLVADACFSGALFADSRRGYADQVEKFKSRWGLASGRLEAVSDGAQGTNSPFAKRVIEFLEENKKEKFAISELIQYVKTQVAENSDQTPIGGPIKSLGDEGGEMVFYLRKN